jgi:hypothetical protein
VDPHNQYLITVKGLEKVYGSLEEIRNFLRWCVTGITTRLKSANTSPMFGPFVLPFEVLVIKNDKR